MSVKTDLLKKLFPEGGQVRELASQDELWCAAAKRWIETKPHPKMSDLKSESDRVRSEFADGKRPIVGECTGKNSASKERFRRAAALKDHIRDRSESNE